MTGVCSGAKQFGFNLPADCIRMGTAGMKPASRGGIFHGRHLTGQNGPLLFRIRVRHRDCGKQRPGIRMAGMVVNSMGIGHFNKLAKIHHPDAV